MDKYKTFRNEVSQDNFLEALAKLPVDGIGRDSKVIFFMLMELKCQILRIELK